MVIRGVWAMVMLSFSATVPAVDYFPLAQVRLLDGPFYQAQERNIHYVMAMDADRLLAPYLEEAGLEPRADNYGNWEDSGLNGHIGGHYLTALSLAWAATGRSEIRDRLEYMLDELKRAQGSDGYLGGVPGSDELWRQIAAGDVRADNFSLNDAWVPWYNLHKIFAGLRDAWLHYGSEQARDMLVALAQWAYGLLSDLDDRQMQDMLTAEHGGMNQVLADVAAITGDQRFLSLAIRFSHREILRPLLEGEDRLTGLHANTQIPKVVGFERIARLDDRPDWHRAAEFFWETVVNHRSVAIGGNSVREHFHKRDDFGPMIREVEGPETCNSYNMLRLTRALYAQHPEMRYADYYERTLYNHILSSQDPVTGGLVYFTPMRPQHYRVYSQVHEAMWCCVGTGIENHFKYGEFIYAREGEALYVNLFIPSRLNWPEKGLVLRQETDFPDRSETRLVFETDAEIALKLRYPSWATAPEARVRINGKLQTVSVPPGSYVTLQRAWKKGDTVDLELPMATHLEQLPDGSDYYAILYGPIVLAAATSPFENEALDFLADGSRMGHVAAGPMCPLDEAPVFLADSPDFAEDVERVAGRELRFTVSEQAGLQGLREAELIPFFRLHRSRYMLYWPYAAPGENVVRGDATAREEAARMALEALTIDKVAPGEQQPEAEHDFEGSRTETGVNFGRQWRHASDWFGYHLSDPRDEARYLRVDYWGADRGRSFTVEVNNVVVAEVTLTGEHGPTFHSVEYPLSPEVVSAGEDGRHQVRFIADPGSIAGGIYGVRLLRERPQDNEPKGEIHDR